MSGRKRFYTMEYPFDRLPAYLEDIGQILKLSGMVLQGKGLTLVVLSPTATMDKEYQVVQPDLEEWCEILRASDDPKVFVKDETGAIKAVHRKQQYAISGHVQQRVWVRDDFQCMFCGDKMGDVQLTVDHFAPLELGGVNNMSNYLSACRRCNKRKGDRSPQEYCERESLDYFGLVQYLMGMASKSFITHLAIGA